MNENYQYAAYASWVSGPGVPVGPPGYGGGALPSGGGGGCSPGGGGGGAFSGAGGAPYPPYEPMSTTEYNNNLRLNVPWGTVQIAFVLGATPFVVASLLIVLWHVQSVQLRASLPLAL